MAYEYTPTKGEVYLGISFLVLILMVEVIYYTQNLIIAFALAALVMFLFVLTIGEFLDDAMRHGKDYRSSYIGI